MMFKHCNSYRAILNLKAIKNNSYKNKWRIYNKYCLKTKRIFFCFFKEIAH